MSIALDPVQVDRFEAFYTHYCPEQLQHLHVVLTSFQGKEDNLMDKLIRKFGPWPIDGVPTRLESVHSVPSAAPSKQSSQAPHYTPRSPPGSVPASAKGSVPNTPLARPSNASVSQRPPSRQESVRSAAVASAASPPQHESGTAAPPASPGSAAPSHASSRRAAPAPVPVPASDVGGSAAPSRHSSRAASQASARPSPSGIAPQSSRQLSAAPSAQSPPSMARSEPPQAAAPQPSAPATPAVAPASSVAASAAAVSAPRTRQSHAASAAAPSSVAAPAAPAAAAAAAAAEDGDAEAELQQLRATLASREAELADLRAQADAAARSRGGGGGGGGSALSVSADELSFEGKRVRAELLHAQSVCEENESSLQAKHRRVAELQSRIRRNGHHSTSSVQSTVPKRTHDLIKAAYETLNTQRGVAYERDGKMMELRRQLEEARAAIVASTKSGFHHDIKLYQARKALVAMNDEKASSLRRQDREGSPQQHGSPARHTMQHGTPYAVPAMTSGDFGRSPPPLDTSQSYGSPSPHRAPHQRSYGIMTPAAPRTAHLN